MLVPSQDWPDARSALGLLLEEAVSLRVAAAFVTRSGVEQLVDLITPHLDLALELVARASDATEPEALLRLAEHPNAEVSVVIGRHAKAFHPKLWLIETASELRVLAGSGNLTASGLTTNDEQFEILRFTRADNVAEEHNDRYARRAGAQLAPSAPADGTDGLEIRPCDASTAAPGAVARVVSRRRRPASVHTPSRRRRAWQFPESAPGDA